MTDLKSFTMDQLHGTLTTYEMRIRKEDTKPNEETFKVSKKTKEHNYNHKCSIYESNQELAHFAIKLKYGSGKYKGTLPLKLFDYGRFGNFVSKCPYKEKP